MFFIYLFILILTPKTRFTWHFSRKKGWSQSVAEWPWPKIRQLAAEKIAEDFWCRAVFPADFCYFCVN